MDELQACFYGLKLQITLQEKSGAEFQTFFEKVMTAKHGEDFVAIRPYGNVGDKKCDGYLSSTDSVYQCYAPERLLQDKDAISKIKTDFEGALNHWPNMKEWYFVTNQKALSPNVLQSLQTLKARYPQITIDKYAYGTFRSIVLSLPLDSLIELFGAVPTTKEYYELTFQDVVPVLKYLQKTPPDLSPPLTAPSEKKLEANALSPDIDGLLRIGRRQDKLVEAFFEQYPDPEYGEEIAQGFRNKYLILKEKYLLPDDIFLALRDFAGWPIDDNSKKASAVLAVISYFFERCDIFEDVETINDSAN